MKLLKEAMNTPFLSKEEEIEHIVKVQSNPNEQKSIDILTKSNLRFIYSVARKYQNKGLDLSDLVSEGVCGLIRAIKSFDINRNVKFLSYAVWYIREAINTAISESRMVRIPQNKATLINKFRAELVKNDNNYVKTINMVQFAEHKNYLHEVMSKTEVASLDAPILTEDGTITLADKISSDPSLVANGTLPVECDVKNIVASEFPKILDSREMSIINLTLGIGVSRPLNNEEVGDQIGLTGERVRQIRTKIYTKVMKHEHIRKNLYQLWRQ
jgi:RNA polymerase primary sigma factor